MAAGIPILDPDKFSLSVLREFWFKTLARLISEQLNAQPHLDPHIDAYKAFGVKLDAVMAQDKDIGDGMILADAKAYAADTQLNKSADDVSAAIHGGKTVNVTLPKHKLYFGKLPTHEAKRPILGAQLEMQELWPDMLAKDSSPDLQKLEPSVAASVKLGVAARQGVKDAYALNVKFRLDGPRRQIFDDYNALAAATYGALSALRSEHPELGLPTDFAESCFRHISRDPGPQSVAEVDELLAKLKADETKLLEKRAELVAQEADQAKADAELEDAMAEAEKAGEDEDQAKKKTKAAKAKLKAAQKKAKKKGK